MTWSNTTQWFILRLSAILLMQAKAQQSHFSKITLTTHACALSVHRGKMDPKFSQPAARCQHQFLWFWYGNHLSGMFWCKLSQILTANKIRPTSWQQTEHHPGSCWKLETLFRGRWLFPCWRFGCFGLFVCSLHSILKAFCLVWLDWSIVEFTAWHCLAAFGCAVSNVTIFGSTSAVASTSCANCRVTLPGLWLLIN